MEVVYEEKKNISYAKRRYFKDLNQEISHRERNRDSELAKIQNVLPMEIQFNLN